LSPCESIQTTPTTRIPTGFLCRLVRQDCPEDPKRLGIIVATAALALGFLICTATISIQAFRAKPLDNGLLTFTAGVGLTLGGLAGAAHRKPDDPLPLQEQQ
jgi:hypothetical protein